ncbi:MAG TPA: SBBP repeat-containing protein, partial [Verrucomicrobiales bacterium]|nr:SBBP repeat-containing protein [Verrucomicrobiales bacterium]
MRSPHSISAATAAICVLSAGIVKAYPPAQWVNYYGDSAGSSARCGAITADAEGSVIVVGTYPAFSRIRTLKLSAAGETLWERFSGDATSGTQAEGKAVATDPAGNIYVAGRFKNDSVLMKYSSSGELLWQKTWGTETTNEGADFVVIDNAGDIYVAGSGGTVSGNPASEDIFLIRYDSAGTEKWVRRYDGQAHGADHCGGLAAAGAGGVVITGSATEPAGVKFITLRYT